MNERVGPRRATKTSNVDKSHEERNIPGIGIRECVGIDEGVVARRAS
jgi:hypothetical protein